MSVRAATSIRLVLALGALALGACSSSKGDDPPRDAVRTPDECVASTPKTFARVECLEPYMKDLTMTSSARVAMCRAQDLVIDQVVDDCHWLAHTIGQANLEKSGGDVGAAFATCPLGCVEGCYHGVISSWFVGRDPSTLSQDLLTVCKSYPTGSVMLRQCIHGIGHGLLMHGRLTLGQAVAACRSSTDSFFVETCLGGVFMENANTVLGFPEAQLLGTLPSLCDGLASSDTRTCVSAIGEGLMFFTGHDLVKATALCKQGAPQQYLSDCLNGAMDEAMVTPEQRCTQ
jgi:hypothetical protein